jgi:hypothetical protein
MLWSRAVAAAGFAVAAAQWGGVAVAAKNTKPHETVVVGSKIRKPSEPARRTTHTPDWTNPLPGRMGAPPRLQRRAPEPKARILRQQGRPFLDSDTNEGAGQ